jgi:hypothetical protein
MHTGGPGGRGRWWRRGGTSITPSKDFKILDRKNAIKHVNKGPLPRFSHNPKYPLKRI